MLTLKKNRRPMIFGFLTLIAAAAIVMNDPRILIETVPLWYRIAEPALLITGLIGSIVSSKQLRVVGWIGISLFFLVFMAAGPDLDHGDPELRGAPTLWRLALVLAVWVSLAVCFRKCAIKPNLPRDLSNVL